MPSFKSPASSYLWFAALGGLALLAFLFFRSSIYTRGQHAYLQATGNATGCSLSDALFPLDLDLGQEWRRYNNANVLTGEDDGLRSWQTPEGDYWTPSGTDLAFLLAEQQLDLYQIADSARGIRKGDTVLDCGANVGTFTRKALESGAARVIAIEVSPRNIESLERTFAREIEAGQVTIVPLGVWNEQSSMDLLVYENSALDSLVMSERHEEGKAPRLVKVELTTIDQLVEDLDLDSVDFIKMDIEGAERNALEGARQTIQRFHPRLAVAAENLEDDVTKIPEILRATYDGYRLGYGRCRITGPSVARPEVLNFY